MIFIKAKEHNIDVHIYFKEKSNIPEELKDRLLDSKGFIPEIILNDYLLRGKIVKLHVKRIRRPDKTSREIHQRDWRIVAKGAPMIKDFERFLKKRANIIVLPLK